MIEINPSTEKETRARALLGQIADVRGKLQALIDFLEFLIKGTNAGEAVEKFNRLLYFYQISHRLITHEGQSLLCGLELGEGRELSQQRLQQVQQVLKMVRSNPWFSNVEFPEGSYDPQPVQLPDSLIEHRIEMEMRRENGEKLPLTPEVYQAGGFVFRRMRYRPDSTPAEERDPWNEVSEQ